MDTQTLRDQTAAKVEDLRDPLRALLSNLAETGINAFVGWLRLQAPTPSPSASPVDVTTGADDGDDAARDAAALLGLSVGASVAEVRAAFRSRVKVEMATGTFHDQRGGGDTDAYAQRLIAAKNLLIERAMVDA
jgi:hypothetical protein